MVQIIILLFLFLIDNFSLFGIEIKDIIKNADLFLDISEYENAIEYYKKALVFRPKIIDIRKNIAYAYFQLDEKEKAIKSLEEELTLFPENGDAYDLLVYILFKQNRIEETYDLFENYRISLKSKIKSHNLGLGDFALGIYFKDTKNYSEAKRYLKRAMERGYDKTKCYIKLIEIELIHDNFESIRNVINEAFNLCGNQPEIFFMEGIHYFEKSKINLSFLQKAVEKFENAISLNPYFEEVLFNLAAIYYNFKDFNKASEYFERILNISPENSEARFFLKCSLYKSKKSTIEPDISLEECPEKIDLKKTLRENIEYKYQFKNDRSFILQNINSLALSYIRNGNLNKAIEKLLHGIKVWEESPVINYNLGMIYFLLDSLKEAERYAIRATKSFFKSGKKVKFYFGIGPPPKERPGKIFSTEFMPIEKWSFELALERGNHFLEAYDLLGNIYFKAKEFDKSIKAFKKVIEINSNDALGYYNLGCAYFALREFSEAEENWKKAIKYDKRKKEKGEEPKEAVSGEVRRISVIVLKRTVSFHSYKSLGSLYAERGEIKKAIESYRKAIDIFPTDADCYYELGKLYLKEGDKQNAIKYLKKYLEYGTEREKEVKELLEKLQKRNY
ncbi:MAG: tetratricopeptide repeat protein [Acidobacteriota bacterium]